MIKNFEKLREVMVLNILNLVLKGIEKVRKMLFKNGWEPCVLYSSCIQSSCARKHNEPSQDNYLTATLAGVFS